MKTNLRNFFCWLLANLLIAFGFVRRATRKAMNGEFMLSVYFHRPSRKEFESCVKWLVKNNYTFLSTGDIENIVRLNLPFPKGAVILTVDDGWQTNETNIAEIANHYKVPVTIFVSTAPAEEGVYWWSYIREAKRMDLCCPSLKTLKGMPDSERLVEVEKIKQKLCLEREAMTVEQITRVATSEYVTIGAHTHSHPILINCSEEQLFFELELCRTHLESWTGKEVTSFAYPNGDYGPREMQALQELNYRVAFCSDPRRLTPDCLMNHYMLPRFGFLEGASFSENICRIVGVWQPLMRSLKTPFINKERRRKLSASSGQGKKLVTQQ